MGNVLPTKEEPRLVNRTFEPVPSVYNVDPKDVVAVEMAQEQAMRGEAVYREKMFLLQDMLRKCYRAAGVNHHEECREDAITMIKYLSYYNEVDFSDQ